MPRLLLVVFLFALASPAAAITLGQHDDFSTLQLWQRGVLATPGPAGASDSFLRVDSVSGGSQGGKVVTFNQAQWAGDYLAVGVTRITLQLSNPGTAALEVRLAFGDNNAPRLGGSWYATTQSFVLAPGSGWTSVGFDIGAADLVLVDGSASYASVMSNVATFRILHATAPSAIGDTGIGSLGVDSVTALPEVDASSLLTLVASVSLLRARGRD